MLVSIIKTIIMMIIETLMPKKLGVKLIIFLLEWASKKTKWKWDDEVVKALKESI